MKLDLFYYFLRKPHTPCIHHHLGDKTHRSHYGLIKRARQTPSLLTLSPFLCSLSAFIPFFLPPVFISIFSISWALLAVSISFCNVEFIGWHMLFGPVTYFQGQYSLYFFPFVCSIFLVIFFALVDFVFNAFLVFFFFLQPLRVFESYEGV